MFCIKCGKKVSENDKFCQFCGERADNAGQPQNIKQTNLDKGVNPRKLKLRKDVWKPILIIIAVLGFFGWAIFASENSGENNNSGLISVGKYLCTDYHADQAHQRAPNTDYTDEINRLEIMKKEIDSMYVDKYSEVSVSSYNSKIDQYNTQWDSLEQRINTTDVSLDEYNIKVNNYNSYLENNCDRR